MNKIETLESELATVIQNQQMILKKIETLEQRITAHLKGLL